METPEGKVVEIVRNADGERAIVDVEAAAACPRCAAGRGCGAGILQGSGKIRRVEALIDDGVTLRKGDRVRTAARRQQRAESQRDRLRHSARGRRDRLPPLRTCSVWVTPAPPYLAIAGPGNAGLVFAFGRRRLQRRGCLSAFTPTAVGRLSTGS